MKFLRNLLLVMIALLSGFLFAFLVTDGRGSLHILSWRHSRPFGQVLTPFYEKVWGQAYAPRENMQGASFQNTEYPIQDTRYATEAASLMFVGDIMLDRGVEKSVNKNFGGDWNVLFENLGSLKEADILFGNLEGPVSDEGHDVGNKWSFRMDPAVLPALRDAGFDVVSFANNHVADWGPEAFVDTLIRLNEHQIRAAGAGFYSPEAAAPRVFVRGGIKIGFLAFSDVGPKWLEAEKDKPGILLADDPYFESIIKNASLKVDFLVVSFHFGEEYEKHTRRQEELSRAAIDAGAKLVVGHHSHVIQDTEEYRGGLIAYSLGNFIFDQYFSEETMQGLLLEVKIARNPLSEKVEIAETKENVIKLSSAYRPYDPKIADGGQSLAAEPRTRRYGAKHGGTVPPELYKLAEEQSYEKKESDEAVVKPAAPPPAPPVEEPAEEPVEVEPLLAETQPPPTDKEIYYRSHNQNKIAITIDDGWNIDRVNQALDILKKENVKATLFPVGVIIQRNPSVWEKALELGMELGNHSYTHPYLYEIDKERAEIEIKRWQEAIQRALASDYRPTWFRPPGMKGFTEGEIDENYYRVIEENGLKVALWSLGTYWGIYRKSGLNVRPNEVARYILSNASGGDVILLHFIKPDIDALSLIITGLKQKGFELVTLSELFGGQYARWDRANPTPGDYLPVVGRLRELDSINNCPKPQKEFADFSLYNVNKKNSLRDYIPDDLVPIKTLVKTYNGRDTCLRKEAALALYYMFLGAQKEKLEFVVTSGFRDFYWQKALFENKSPHLSKERWGDKMKGNLLAAVFPSVLSVAPAGHSEHQLGTAVDLTSPSVGFESASGNFYKSPEYKWLKENAYLYGFIESYPRGKENITGYKYEPWHWRYVGVENARLIKGSGLTIQEFLENQNVDD